MTATATKPCPRQCDRGWVTVTAAYVDRYAPIPTPPDPTAPAATWAEYDQLAAHVHAIRAGLVNTVYPCRHCRPSLFYRWVGRHFEPDHDAGACTECHDVRRGKPVDVPEPTAPDDDDWTHSRADLR